MKFKAYVLPVSAIKPYSQEVIPGSEMEILQFIHVVGFIAVFLFVPVFVVFLSKSLYHMESRSRSVIARGTIVSLMFNMMSMFAELHHLNKLNNWFAITKLIFMLIVFFGSVINPRPEGYGSRLVVRSFINPRRMREGYGTWFVIRCPSSCREQRSLLRSGKVMA